MISKQNCLTIRWDPNKYKKLLFNEIKYSYPKLFDH